MNNLTVLSAKNSFQDGLVLDFSPENTPATSLSSALNATLLTFNGNEMSLQNDMGNGRVETAYLPEGYVPVGTCEFGDIIYIVSYNPLINKSLIGCFPSPERNISSTEVSDLNATYLSYTDFLCVYEDTGEPTGELKTNSVKKIVFLKNLNAGDKYIITGSNIDSTNTDPEVQAPERDNFSSLSGYGAGDIEVFPRMLTLHVVSIQDSGKIEYLDTTVKWYDNFYIKDNPGSKDTPILFDVDNYRSILSSGYSVFSSKVSGKLAILAELNTIDSFSCTHSIYKTDILDANKKIDHYEYDVYLNTNWTAKHEDIMVSGLYVKEWDTTGWDPEWSDRKSKPWGNNGPSINFKDRKLVDQKDPKSGDTYYHLNTECDFSTYLTSYAYLIKKENFEQIYTKHKTESGEERPLKIPTLAYLVISKDEQTNKTIPKIGYYHLSRDKDKVKNEKGEEEYKYGYRYDDKAFEYKAYHSLEISDTLIHNYFNKDIVSLLTTFSFDPTIINEKTPILKYSVCPAMPYGYLGNFETTNIINFKLVGTGAIDLTGWRYYNDSEVSTLTFGLSAYPEENKGIAKVVIEFYDNTGFAASLTIKDKESYSGTFTEKILLNSDTSLSSKNYLGIELFHEGLSAKGNEFVDNAGEMTNEDWINFLELLCQNYYKINDYLFTKEEKDGEIIYKYDTVTISSEDTDIKGCLEGLLKPSDPSKTPTIYQNDAGILYSNTLYLARIYVFYLNYDSLGELDPDEIDEDLLRIFERFYWTNSMFNENYFTNEDFLSLKIPLTISTAVAYKPQGYSTKIVSGGNPILEEGSEFLAETPDMAVKTFAGYYKLVHTANSMDIIAVPLLTESYSTFFLSEDIFKKDNITVNVTEGKCSIELGEVVLNTTSGLLSGFEYTIIPKVVTEYEENKDPYLLLQPSTKVIGENDIFAEENNKDYFRLTYKNSVETTAENPTEEIIKLQYYSDEELVSIENPKTFTLDPILDPDYKSNVFSEKLEYYGWINNKVTANSITQVPYSGVRYKPFISDEKDFEEYNLRYIELHTDSDNITHLGLFRFINAINIGSHWDSSNSANENQVAISIGELDSDTNLYYSKGTGFHKVKEDHSSYWFSSLESFMDLIEENNFNIKGFIPLSYLPTKEAFDAPSGDGLAPCAHERGITQNINNYKVELHNPSNINLNFLYSTGIRMGAYSYGNDIYRDRISTYLKTDAPYNFENPSLSFLYYNKSQYNLSYAGVTSDLLWKYPIAARVIWLLCLKNKYGNIIPLNTFWRSISENAKKDTKVEYPANLFITNTAYCNTAYNTNEKFRNKFGYIDMPDIVASILSLIYYRYDSTETVTKADNIIYNNPYTEIWKKDFIFNIRNNSELWENLIYVSGIKLSKYVSDLLTNSKEDRVNRNLENYNNNTSLLDDLNNNQTISTFRQEVNSNNDIVSNYSSTSGKNNTIKIDSDITNVVHPSNTSLWGDLLFLNSTFSRADNSERHAIYISEPGKTSPDYVGTGLPNEPANGSRTISSGSGGNITLLPIYTNVGNVFLENWLAPYAEYRFDDSGMNPNISYTVTFDYSVSVGELVTYLQFYISDTFEIHVTITNDNNPSSSGNVAVYNIPINLSSAGTGSCVISNKVNTSYINYLRFTFTHDIGHYYSVPRPIYIKISNVVFTYEEASPNKTKHEGFGLVDSLSGTIDIVPLYKENGKWIRNTNSLEYEESLYTYPKEIKLLLPSLLGLNEKNLTVNNNTPNMAVVIASPDDWYTPRGVYFSSKNRLFSCYGSGYV